MKIRKKDLRHGTVHVAAETPDDLWYLHTLIDPGDLVTGSSEYKFKLGGAEGKQKVVKKRVTVQVSVEKTELQSGLLRVSGSVTGGSEDVPRGSHHGLDVEPGTDITIQKEAWLDFQLEKLDDAVHASSGSVVLVLFDREQALFAKLTPNGFDVLSELKGDVPKKGVDEGRQHAFYKEICTRMEGYKAEHFIAGSPAFWKQYLEKELPAELKKKTLFTSVSSVDASAITELLKRPELQQALQGERLAKEERMLEQIMEALGKDRLAYGKKDVAAVIAEGNISALFVSETAIQKAREQGKFSELETLMRQANGLQAPVRLLSTKEAARKVDGLGGIVAVKRW